MIQIEFSIRLPYHWAKDRAAHGFVCKSGRLFGTKCWEFEILGMSPTVLLEGDLDLRWSGYDHVGPKIAFTILGLYVCAQVYDNRHWNHTENRWELPDDDHTAYRDEDEDETGPPSTNLSPTG